MSIEKDFRRLQEILSKAIKWYKENEADEDFVYDEAWREFSQLDRGDCLDILKILAEREG